MTTYYTPTGNPPNQTRGISTTMRAEFILIQTAFGAVNTDVLARGLISGQTWSGAHDFTAGSIRVPTQAVGDDSTLAASTSFVQQLAAFFAAQGAAGQLPSQAGKADYLLNTSGSVSGWTNALKATVIRFKDGADATKLLAFDLTAITTATTRTLTAPNKSGTIALTSDLVVTKFYQSTEQTITPAGLLTLAHGLGAAPKFLSGFLKCVTAEYGYAVGDVLYIALMQNGQGSGNGVGVTIDASNVYVKFSNTAAGVFSGFNKSTGAPNTNPFTDANWTFSVRAIA